MAYSNPDYGVAGYLIWKVSHEQFNQYIRDNILTPLGMTVSGFTLTDKIFAELARATAAIPRVRCLTSTSICARRAISNPLPPKWPSSFRCF